MSEIIYAMVVITPKPGMIDKVIETLVPYEAFIRKECPGTLQYQLFQQTNSKGEECLILIETFKDAASLKFQSQSPAYQELARKGAEDGLLATAYETKYLKLLSGWPLHG